METTHSHLVRELEEKRELILNLYAKLQLEKQVGTNWQVTSLFVELCCAKHATLILSTVLLFLPGKYQDMV
jgi:hypothetical protein